MILGFLASLLGLQWIVCILIKVEPIMALAVVLSLKVLPSRSVVLVSLAFD